MISSYDDILSAFSTRNHGSHPAPFPGLLARIHAHKMQAHAHAHSLDSPLIQWKIFHMRPHSTPMMYNAIIKFVFSNGSQKNLDLSHNPTFHFFFSIH